MPPLQEIVLLAVLMVQLSVDANKILGRCRGSFTKTPSVG